MTLRKCINQLSLQMCCGLCASQNYYCNLDVGMKRYKSIFAIEIMFVFMKNFPLH